MASLLVRIQMEVVPRKRPGMGGADTLLVTELSRLGRSLKQVLEVVEDLTERKVNICFQAQGLNTIVDGKPDATVKAMVSMFGAFAELERSTIVDRLQSGRRVATERGVRMGYIVLFF